MGALILEIAVRYISIFLILVSAVAFFSGHNHPGGGFIGALIASIAFIVSCFARDVKTTLKKLRVDSRVWMITGLLMVLASGLIGVFYHKPFLSGIWVSFHMKWVGIYHLGTPNLFDLGVYVLVIGAVSTIISNLTEN